MKQEICCKCNVRFAMNDETYNYYISTGENFYCPNGHGQHYLKTESKHYREIKELKSRNEQLQKIINKQSSTIRQLYNEIHFLRRDHCPHCEKWYVNLDSHIKKMHRDEG